MNEHCQKWVNKMTIDEKRELFDLSDHNVIIISVSLPQQISVILKNSKVSLKYLKTTTELMKTHLKNTQKN